MIEKYISFLKGLFLRIWKSYLKLAPTEIYYLNCIIEEYNIDGDEGQWIEE